MWSWLGFGSSESSVLTHEDGSQSSNKGASTVNDAQAAPNVLNPTTTTNTCIPVPRVEGMNTLMHPARRVEKLHLDRGIHLTRYGGGDDMREAVSLLHFSAENVPVNDSIFEAKILTKIRQALENVTELSMFSEYHPPEYESVIWDKCKVDISIHISTNIRGDPSVNTANAFFHGWLFEDAAESNRFAQLLFPLITVLSSDSGCIKCSDDVESDVGAIKFNGDFRFANQHLHHVDTISFETLIENGVPEDDAKVFLELEKAAGDDYYLGSDMAHFKIDPSHATGSAVFVACDLQDPATPRVLISFVTVVMQSDSEQQVRGINDSLRTIYSAQGSVSIAAITGALSQVIPDTFPTAPVAAEGFLVPTGYDRRGEGVLTSFLEIISAYN
jgi:hypothetical protein